MGSFTVHADFNQLDGGATQTKSVAISSNVQVIADGGVIYDSANHYLTDGVLEVQLPANDNEPGEFGYTIRRATGLTKTWRVPAQDPGAWVELTDFTATTPLPLPASGNAVSQTEFESYQTSNDAAVDDLTTDVAGKLDKAANLSDLEDVTEARQWLGLGTAAVAGSEDFEPAGAVSDAIDALLSGAPGALDTLNELAAALGDDANFATTVTNALATKVNSSTYTAALAAIRDLSDSTLAASLAAAFVTQATGDSRYPRPTGIREPHIATTLYTGTVVNQNGGTDSSDNLFATDSGYCQTAGGGVGNSCRISGMTLPDMTDKGVWVPLKVVSNGAHLSKLFLQFGTDTSYTNYYQLDLPTPPTGKSRLVEGKWVGVYVPWSAFSVAAGSPTATTLTSFKVVAQDDNTGNSVRVLVGTSWGIYTEQEPTGTFTVSCDDTWPAALDVCRKLAESGARALLFPIVSRLDQASYLTTAQLRECRDAFGAEVGVHCMDDAHHVTLVGQSTSAIKSQMLALRDWQQSMGFTSSAMAYPIGPFDSSVVQTVGQFYNYQRTNDSLQGTAKLYGGPVVSAVALTSGNTLVQLKAMVDAAVANRSNLHLVVHQLLPSGTPSGNQWLLSDFQALIDYIVASGLRNAMPADQQTQTPTATAKMTLESSYARPVIAREPRPAMTMLTSAALVSQNGGTDSSDPLISANGPYAQTSGNGVGNSARLDSLVLPDMTGKGIWLPLKVVSNASKLYKVYIMLGTSSTMASSYQLDFTPPSLGNSRLYNGQWVGLFIPFSAFTNATVVGTPSPTTLTSVKVTAQDDNTGTGVRILLDANVGIYTEQVATGTITVSCDDTWPAALDACKKMAAYGWRPILFPIPSHLDTGSYLTTAQLRRCHDVFGAEVGAHAMTDAQHVSLVGQSATAVRAMLTQLRDWQRSMGFTSSAFAFPNGSYDASTVSVVSEFYNYQRTNDNQIGAGKLYGGPVVSAISLASTLTLAQAKAKVDAAVSHKGNVHFLVHQLLPSGTPSGNQWLTSDFNTLIDYAAAQGLKAAMPADQMA